MAKPGPKPIEINWSEFDKLCAFQCTAEEIASWFDCSVDTIENKVEAAHGLRFSEYFKQKRQKGKISLRRRQFQAAMEGNTALLIFLGKQYLGQSDKVETTDSAAVKLNLTKEDLVAMSKAARDE